MTTTLIAEPGKHIIIMLHCFNAPRELVFRAMTDPRHIPQWWGKRNHTTIVDQMAVKVGGPMWPMWEAAAPTLAYDAAVMGEDGAIPIEKATRVVVPALVMDGGASFPFMHVAATALAKAMPYAQHRTLDSQTHEVSVDVLAPVLIEFFNFDAASLRKQT